MSISFAMAGRCRIVLVEQPRAMSVVMAFQMASSVRTSLARMFFRTSSMTCIPASFASLMRAEYGAGMVPLPERPMPMTSVRQFMEFAVYMPEQEPQDGQTFSSYSLSLASEILPAEYEPTASNMLERLVLWPSMRPASMGPPETKMVGRFRRAAAIRRPGTFLSQFGIMTRPSKPWALTMASVESAMRSLVTREYFMPSWPMAMPSQTAMAGNTIGVPPPMATPMRTASVILSRFI